MWRLWIFWIEILGFSLYLIWTILADADGGMRTVYASANVIIYGVALIYGGYGFLRFAQRRLWARAS